MLLPDFRQSALWLTLLLIMGIQWGCATRGDYNHRSLSHGQISEKGLMVLGVVPFSEQETAMRTNKRSTALSKAVAEARSDYPLVSTSAAKKELGQSYADIMAAYRRNGMLGFEEFEKIRQSRVLSRYVMIAGIDGEKLDHPPERYKEHYDNIGKLRSDKHEIIVSSRRSLSVTAKVYDLRTGRVVWKVTRTPSPSNSASYIVYKGDSFARAVQAAAMNRLSNGSLQHLPPPFPSRETAFEQALEQIVEALPSTGPV